MGGGPAEVAGGKRGGGGGRSGGLHKAARPAFAFAPHPRDGQEGAHVADLGQSIGGLRCKRFNSIMETAALFGRAVDLAEVPAVLEPLFGGLAAVLFSAASLQCWCSATPQAGGFRPLRRGSPPTRQHRPVARRASPRRQPLVYMQYVLSLVLPVVMAAVRMELAYGGDSGEGSRPGGHSLRNGDGPILLRRRLEPPQLLQGLAELLYAAHHLRANYMLQLLSLPERLLRRDADQ